MDEDKFRYAYELEHGGIDEVSEVCWAYTMTSYWKHVETIRSKNSWPTHLIFEWQGTGAPYYPRVNWP